MDDDAMDGSSIKRRSVKELTKKGGKRDGTTKRAKKSLAVESPKKSITRVEKKKKKAEKQTKKDLKKITKDLGKLKADSKGKVKKQPKSQKIDVTKNDNLERLNDAWGKAMKDVAEQTTSQFIKETLEKCEGQNVPRDSKSKFMNWIEEHLHISKTDNFSKLRTLWRSIKEEYDKHKPMTKTHKRKLEKKRSKARKQLQAQTLKAENPMDEETLKKRREKTMKKKEKLKKKKLENLLKKKSGMRIKSTKPLSEEQKDVVMKELKKKKKDKKKSKLLGI